MSDDSEMCTNNQHNFSTTELDPDLLSTPFRLQTNWHVITGAPSCGKTTLINLLADKGFQTVPESARQFMEREIARGRTIDEIHADGAALQRSIEEMQLNVEGELRASDITFLDGAVPGCTRGTESLDSTRMRFCLIASTIVMLRYLSSTGSRFIWTA